MTETQYLAELGVEIFEIEKKSLTATVKCLILEEKTNDSFCKKGETRDLLVKMLVAIGVNMNEVVCETITTTYHQNIAKYTAKVVLLMGDFNNNEYFIVPHPQQILQNLELKKKAWKVLQKVQKCLR